MADIRLSLLDGLRDAAPCPMEWDDLEGDGPVRRCTVCGLDVYNLAAMSRDEAEQVLRDRMAGRLHAAFRRADGTLLKENCPLGLAAEQRRAMAALRKAA